MENILEVKDVCKKFDHYTRFKLKDVSFDLKKGYIMGLIGPNGAGKTTIINIIMNLMKKDSGEILIFGENYKGNEKRIKDRIGFVYDENLYYEELSCIEMKDLIAPFYTKWDNEIFDEYIKTFKINPDKKLKELSKGMKMKFSLAIALSHEAELIIMDEPTDGLDPIARREALNIMQRVVEESETSFLISTHLTADLDRVADYITYLYNGEVIVSTDIETFNGMYRLIRGDLIDLEEIDKDIIIGLEENHMGFSALIESENLDKIKKFNLVIDSPNIEDVMYYMGRDLK